MSDLGTIRPVQGDGSTQWYLPFGESSTELNDGLESLSVIVLSICEEGMEHLKPC